MKSEHPIHTTAARFALVAMIVAFGTAAHAGVTITPDAGYTVTWDGNDGDFFSASDPALAPANLASSVGTQIQSTSLPAGNHAEAGNVNDGFYGNVESWIANDGDLNPFVGIDLNGTYDISAIAWGRDNGNGVTDPGPGGQLVDRNLGTYTVQITNDLTPSGASSWTSIGTLNYVSSDDGVVGGAFTGYYRHEYAVGQTGGGALLATGVRLLVPASGIGVGTAIDEIELYGESPIATSGLQAWLRGDGDVQTSGAAVTQWSDHSGNTNHATPGLSPDLIAGGLNGLDSVRFDSPVEHVNVNSVGDELQDSDYEIFVVARSSSAVVQFLTAGPGGGGDGELELHLNGGTGARFIPSQTNATTDGTHPDTFADLGVAGMFTDGRTHLFNQRVEGNEGFLRVVGMENGDTVLTARSSFLDAAFGLSLGVRGNAGNSFVGDMGEVLIYDRALTETERRKVERYLARKWDAPLNIASQTQGGVAFANQDFGGDESGNPAASHEIEHLNNALYGNSQSWLGNNTGTSGAYAGVKFDGEFDISSLAFGRNANNELGLTDRDAGTYKFEFTRDAFDPTSIASIDAAMWTEFLEITLGDNIADPLAHLRRQYDFDTIFGVTGVRVLVSSNSIAIDELEVYGLATIPTPAALPAGIALLGLIAARRRRR